MSLTHRMALLLSMGGLVFGTGASAANPEENPGTPPPRQANGPGDNSAELAKKLQNPIANLISVPIQNNWDFGIGSTGAMRYTVNVQPVIPFSMGDNWNLITRTIVPIVHAEAPVPGAGDVSGLGDILQSFFFSPKALVGGWVMGAGPAFLYPSASNDTLGGQKWGVGPTVVLLKQQSGWTYGALANHLWSFAGAGDRQEINATYMQPFVSYVTKTFTTIALNTESTYDWGNSHWTMPLNLQVSQLLKFGNQPVQFTLGGRYYPEKPQGGPDWGLRFAVTLLFPK